MKIPFLSDFDEKEDIGVRETLKRAEKDPLFGEQFRALKAKFEYRIESAKLKVLAVTSAIAGEGKTLSCVNLAVNLASSGRKKVLLVDVDLRKADLARGFEFPPQPGLTDYLGGSVGLKDVLRNTFVPGLYVITAGAKPESPADLLAGEKFRTFLAELRDHFDVILLDTPPVIPVADTIGLKDQVDGFVFLFRAGYTPHEMLKQAVEEIGEKNIVGVVLNGVEPRAEKYYKRYYGKYYRKSAGDES